MKYVSTRGSSTDAPRSFTDILLEGLAPDGGLYVPETYPTVDAATLAAWRTLLREEGYPALAHAVVRLFVDDIPDADLRGICERAYTAAKFGDPSIVGNEPLGEDLLLGRISNGPTAAFKDMAMQLLGEFFEHELERRDTTMTVLGATSGDTGSAAEYAMLGKERVTVFMLTPAGRMTPFQQAQMFSLDDPRIHNIAVDGVFDDCQDLVKALNNDAAFKAEYRLGAVNSINWARLLAQVVYYVALWLHATGPFETLADARSSWTGMLADACSSWTGMLADARSSGTGTLADARSSGGETVRVSFAVPSGNFGNICAGHVARMIGVPIDTLILATNENNVLEEFFRTGVYRVRAASETPATSSPSMDISKASNFERFVFDLLGRDGDRVRALFDELAATGRLDLSGTPEFAAIRERWGFVAGTSTHADRIATIRRLDAEQGVVIDPHTADGVKVARTILDADASVVRPVVVLETALPVKFAETIVEALGREPRRPAAFEGIEDLPRRVVSVPNDPDAVRRLIVDASVPDAGRR